MQFSQFFNIKEILDVSSIVKCFKNFYAMVKPILCYATERTRIDKAHIWPQSLRKVKNLYYINIFLTIVRQHASVQENMLKIIIMHLMLPW